MRTAFIEALCEQADRDERIWLLTGDLGFSVLERFSERFPERYVNVGVSEQNMTGIAAGLAMAGKVVLTYSIANFPTLRCLEQIRNDVCYHGADVKIVSVGGGFMYGPQGYSHHGIEDLAVMRALPHMVVMSPADPVEARLAVKAMIESPGPAYLRLGKSGDRILHAHPPAFQIGKGLWLRRGTDVALIGTGGITAVVLEAADELARAGIQASVISMPTLKPLDEDLLFALAQTMPLLVTVEEHSLIGGLGSAIAEVLSASQLTTRLRRLGVAEQRRAEIGSQGFLRAQHHLTASGIASAVIDELQGKSSSR